MGRDSTVERDGRYARVDVQRPLQLRLAEVEGLAQCREGDDECAIHEDLCSSCSTGGSVGICRRMTTYIEDSNPTHREHEKSVVQGGRHSVERTEGTKRKQLLEASGGEVQSECVLVVCLGEQRSETRGRSTGSDSVEEMLRCSKT